MSGQLPSSPNLRYLKNQAKRLLKNWLAGEPVALQELRLLHPSFKLLACEQLAAKMCSHNAHLAIARRYGFQNWRGLSDRVAVMKQADLSALTTKQAAVLLTASDDTVAISAGGIAAVQAEKLARYERGRPYRENGTLYISKKRGLTLEEALNDTARIHNMPPVGTKYTNAHGIEWTVEDYAYFVAPTTMARYPNDCDYLPIVKPQNISPRLSCLFSEVDSCTSKCVVFLDTMPHVHPFGLGRNIHCAHVSNDPGQAHIFLDVKNAYETTIAHELMHLWIWFVEGMDGERVLRDRKDHVRKNQLDFIQSFVLDIKVNNLIAERGFDMSLISKDQFDGLEALRKLVMTGFTPPTRREMLLYCLQIAAVVLEQKRWPGEMQGRLPKMLEFFEATVPEIYATAMELVGSVARWGVETRDNLRAVLDECVSLGFRFTLDEFDLERDLEEVTLTECMRDKYPHELAEYPVPLKLEICRARARHGICGDGTVSVSTSPSGMAMLVLRGKDGRVVGPIQVNYRMELPEWARDAESVHRKGLPPEHPGPTITDRSRVQADPDAPYRHIPMMERPLIRGMTPDDYGRLPNDIGYNSSYPPGKHPFETMRDMNNSRQWQNGSNMQGQPGYQPFPDHPQADKFGRVPGDRDYMMPFPPGHPASSTRHNPIDLERQQFNGIPWPEMRGGGSTRRYMAGLALSVAEARLAQQIGAKGANPYQYANNNPLNYVDPDGMEPRQAHRPIPIPPADPGDLSSGCSLYRWLYTGNWCAPDNVYYAALGGGAEGVSCWANCFGDANKQVLAVVAGALGTFPAWGVPKTFGPVMPGRQSASSVARLISIQVRRRFGNDVANRIGTQHLARFVKANPTMAAAQLAAVVFAWAEAAISAYCAAQCMNSKCDGDDG